MRQATLVYVLLMGLAMSSGLKGRFERGYVSVPDFLEGFVSGVEVPNSNGKCITDVSALEPLFQTIYQDAVKVIDGDYMDVIGLISDVKTAVSDIEGFGSDCDLSGLETVIESLGTTAGWVTVAQNFMANFDTISSDASAFLTCPSNPTQCGFSLGAILRMTLGWGLGSDSAAPKMAFVSVPDFLEGFVNGIEVPNNSGKCITDVSSLEPLFESIYEDAKEVIGGDYFDVIGLISDVKTAISDIEGFDGDCNVNGLVTVIESLGTTAGWVTVAQNFMANFDTISSDASAFLTCPSNPTQCGFSLGAILRLTLGWGLGSDSSMPVVHVRDTEFSTWMDAFLNGLEVDPSSNNACATDLLSLSSNFEAIYNDLLKLSQGNTAALVALLSDGKALLNNLESFSSPCNLPELESTLANLATPSGIMQLVNNITKNWGQIQTDAANVQQCSNNVAACGQSAGELVQLVLGWGI